MEVNSEIENHRPYLRSTMARNLYQKMINEERLKNYDKSLWYKCKLDDMENKISEKFHQLSLDADTQKFLDRSYEKSNYLFTHLWNSFASTFLCLFMTQTSINGFLGRGSMFVFSSHQFMELLEVGSDWRSECLLDLGAGDGEVTATMAPFFDQVYTTEVSSVMQKLLMVKNYTVLDIDGWKGKGSPEKYSVISCLNLLDRCDEPITLLKDIKEKLSPSGFLLVGLVLPVSQFVESNKTHNAKEELSISGNKFEDQIPQLFKLFNELGFKVVRWSRLPYLCEGDMQQPLYWLDDSLFVLKLNDIDNL